MTTEDIVRQARTRLGDTRETGWNDDVLIRYVDQGQKDLCKLARVYKRTLHLGLENDTTLFPLPTDCFQVDRIEYQGEYLSLLSREDQDIRHQSKGLHIIKNDINMSVIEISEPFEELTDYAEYVGGITLDTEDTTVEVLPIVGVPASHDSLTLLMDNPVGVITYMENTNSAENCHRVPTDFGDVSGIYTDLIHEIPNYTEGTGVTTAIDFGYVTDDRFFGFLSEIDNKRAVGTYGICTDALVLDNYLKVYYSAIPNTVKNLHDALIVSDIWSKALVHYVVGMARQDDNDESNFMLGAQELSKYDKEVVRAKKLSARSYSSPVTEVKETTYRRI